MDKRPPSTDHSGTLFGETVPTLDRKSGSGEYYLPTAHIQLLEQVEHLSRYSHFIQIITGVSGSGKTTLLQQFHPGADDRSVQICCIQALPEMSRAALLAELCLQLNMNGDCFNVTADPFQALIGHAELLKQLSRQWLIVIDDAENLALDALELLFNQLSTLDDDDVRPHIVLFAAPQINPLIEAPSLREVVNSSCHFIEMPTLDRDALNNLLAHCFSAASARLDETQRQRIHTDSLGLPGRVARALETVSAGTTTAKPTNHTATPSTALRLSRPWYLRWPALAISLLVGLSGWLVLSPQSRNEPAVQLADASNRVRIELSIEPKAESKLSIESELDTAHLDNGFEQRLAQARAVQDVEQQPLEQPHIAPPPAIAPLLSGSETLLPSQQLEQASIKAASEPLMASTEATNPPLPQQQPTATLALKLPTPEAQQPTLQPDLPLQLKSLSPVTAQPEQPPSKPSYFGDGQALLTWNTEDYTLQLLGARRQQSVIEFIASMPESDKLRYFSTLYKGKPWYVVVYGNYPSRNAAMSARGDLPPQLRARNPWARSIEGIQEDIRKGNL